MNGGILRQVKSGRAKAIRSFDGPLILKRNEFAKSARGKKWRAQVAGLLNPYFEKCLKKHRSEPGDASEFPRIRFRTAKVRRPASFADLLYKPFNQVRPS